MQCKKTIEKTIVQRRHLPRANLNLGESVSTGEPRRGQGSITHALIYCRCCSSMCHPNEFFTYGDCVLATTTFERRSSSTLVRSRNREDRGQEQEPNAASGSRVSRPGEARAGRSALSYSYAGRAGRAPRAGVRARSGPLRGLASYVRVNQRVCTSRPEVRVANGGRRAHFFGDRDHLKYSRDVKVDGPIPFSRPSASYQWIRPELKFSRDFLSRGVRSRDACGVVTRRRHRHAIGRVRRSRQNLRAIDNAPVGPRSFSRPCGRTLPAFARVDTECVPSSLIFEDFAVNLVPVFNSEPDTVPNFDPDHVLESQFRTLF
ncbi:hypothetical protein EVAR_93176_1 [Eumeta japonica]|uniref:Uncharacterized protein n=1 Tax=Eumeta variegata TaxID=151549 RepID=A0A4C1TIL5_EUMVA|nr:hypothetical protein EVAR_93176_1 [Eumeta japonica]